MPGFLLEHCFGFYLVIVFVAKNELALALLVTWVLTNNHHATVTTDDLALIANLFDARINLHV